MAIMTPGQYALIMAEVIPTSKNVVGFALSDGSEVHIPIELFNAADLICDWFSRNNIKEWALCSLCSRSYEAKYSAQLETLEQIRKLVSSKGNHEIDKRTVP